MLLILYGYDLVTSVLWPLRAVCTCAIKANEAVATPRVELQAGVTKELLAVESERQAADVHISAVGVRRQHPSHCSCLNLLQLKLIQLLYE